MNWNSQESALLPQANFKMGGFRESEAGRLNCYEDNAVRNMKVQVGDTIFSATLEENVAVSALVEMMRESPVVLQMNDYSGFEKVGPLGTSLPADNSQTTTHAGDILRKR